MNLLEAAAYFLDEGLVDVEQIKSDIKNLPAKYAQKREYINSAEYKKKLIDAINADIQSAKAAGSAAMVSNLIQQRANISTKIKNELDRLEHDYDIELNKLNNNLKLAQSTTNKTAQNKAKINTLLTELKSDCNYNPVLDPKVLESDDDAKISAYLHVLEDIKKLYNVYVNGGNKFTAKSIRDEFLNDLVKSKFAYRERGPEVTYFNYLLNNIITSKLTKSVTIEEIITPIEDEYLFNDEVFFVPDVGIEVWKSKAEEILGISKDRRATGTQAYRRRQRQNSVNAFKENCELRNRELKDATDDTYQIVKGGNGSSRPMLIDKKKKLQLTISDVKQTGEDKYGKTYDYAFAEVFANGTIDELVNTIKYFFKMEYGKFYTNPTVLDSSVRFTHKGDAIVAVAPELFSENGFIGGLSGTKQLANGTVLHFVNLSEGRTEEGNRYGYSKVENEEGENPYYNEFNPKDGELLIISEDDKMNNSYLNGNVDHIVFEIDSPESWEKESTSNYNFLGVFKKATEQARDNGGYMVNYYLESNTLEVSGHSENEGEVTTESKKVRNALKLLKENGYLVEF